MHTVGALVGRDRASCAGELDHEHTASNGCLADGDSGLYGHHLEASPANGHLHPLRLEPMLQPHFNRSRISVLPLDARYSIGPPHDMRPDQCLCFSTRLP